jgi:N-acetylglucosaminyldiphosphoundecaprenol N-acetyl-beta-D-mannosaminyltransferase
MVYQAVMGSSHADDAKRVFGIAFSPLTFDRLVRRIAYEPVPAGSGARLVATANLDHIANLSRNRDFRAAYARAWAATADGVPVYLYVRLRNGGVSERITGADMFKSLAKRLSPGRHRPFFVVNRDVTGQRIRDNLVARGFLPASIGLACPKYGFERDEVYSSALAELIRRHGTTHLFFALGAPKSEIWIDRHRNRMGDCYALAIGASVEFYVGLRKRAPAILQRLCLEWLWRFLHEPRRLFRRYFVDSWRVLAEVRADLFPRRPAVAAPAPRKPEIVAPAQRDAV